MPPDSPSPGCGDRYPVGTRLRHHGGSEWEVSQRRDANGDRRIRCVRASGSEKVGSEISVHDEYVPRSFIRVPVEGQIGVRVATTDLKTGAVESKEFVDDYLLIAGGDRYVSGVQHYANGTSVITVKRGDPGA